LHAVMPAMVSKGSGENETVPGEMEWRVHPLTENVWRSALLIAIIVAVCLGVWLWTGWGGLVLIAAGLLVVSVAPYLFPVRYRMTNEGIEIKFLGVRTFRSWNEFRNYYPHDVGVHLSPFRAPSGLDPFRGSFIRFAPGNRKAVLRFLDAHIKRAESARKKGESEG
jgi:hypothetical protein